VQNLPKHIVIIPDGNRRWAKKRGLPSFFGHREGAKTTEKLLKTALDMKIPYLTFWGCSVDNVVKRPKEEVGFLFDIFAREFKRLANDKDIHERQVKIDFLGRWEEFLPEGAKKSIKEAVEKTKNYKNYHLTFLMAYSGTDEMTAAIQRIAELRMKNEELRIDDNLIKKNLWTKDLPPVDLAIRTGGEPHWSSGMMMWDIANAHFYFTETLFPAFSVEEFKKAVDNFGKTERRLGK
jgi:undecaprenyl diphosphate synthase